MDNSSYKVDHVRLATDKPFDAVRADFERQVGRVDPEAYKTSVASRDPARARATLKAMEGPGGLMLFATHDHGSLLMIAGLERKALQYIIGNPLIAIQMTCHAIAASLYAPLRVLLYEDADGKACIEYDLPSTIFAQFGDDRIDQVAASLDKKLADLAASAMR